MAPPYAKTRNRSAGIQRTSGTSGRSYCPALSNRDTDCKGENMRTIRRLFIAIAVSASTVVAAVASGPAAFAQSAPDPAGAAGGGAVTGSVGQVSTAPGSGGMLGWQIALIAVGAALLAAVVTAAVDRFAFYRRLAHQTV